jgi:hypothetical protein
MVIGVLKGLGEFWPRTKANVGEIQGIARSVLGLDGVKEKHMESLPANTGVLAEQQAVDDGMVTVEDYSLGERVSLGTSPFGWFDPADLSQELSWWIR